MHVFRIHIMYTCYINKALAGGQFTYVLLSSIKITLRHSSEYKIYTYVLDINCVNYDRYSITSLKRTLQQFKAKITFL